MHSKSNPLMRELAKVPHPGPHPEADVLTAFAEGTLLKRERTDVLQHLANCAACREIVHTSMDAAPELLAEPKVNASPAGWGYRQWMPWAVAVAASLLVVTILTVHRHSSKPDSNNKSDYIAKVEQPLPPTDQVRQTLSEAPKKKTATRPASAPRNNSIPAEYSRERQSDLHDAVRAQSLSAAEFAPAAPEPQPSAKDQQLAQMPRVQQETQTTDLAQGVANAQSAIAPAPPTPSSTNEVVREETLHGALARKSAAGPAPAAKPSFMAGAISSNVAVAGTAAALLHWRISSEGRVEREIGAGQWEPMLALEPAKMRVVTVYGRTVWAGGDSQRLYRSTDNGATWSSVALPNKGAAPHSIAHILFTSPAAGTVEAEDGTQWTTTDGGASWQ